MKGIYKKNKELYIFEFISYKNLIWKNLLKQRALLAPKLHFHKKGILLLYSLRHCVIEDNKLYFKGKEMDLLKLSR